MQNANKETTKDVEKTSHPYSSERKHVFSRPQRVFVIEDDVELSTILDTVLKTIDPNVQIDWATSAEEATARLVKRARHSPGAPYDLIIADIFLEGSETGLDLWRMCSQVFPDVPLVITSALPVDKYFSTLGSELASPPFLAKPFTIGECKQMLEAMLEYNAKRHDRH